MVLVVVVVVYWYWCLVLLSVYWYGSLVVYGSFVLFCLAKTSSPLPSAYPHRVTAKVLTSPGSNSSVAKRVALMDADGDGVVSFVEFYTAMSVDEDLLQAFGFGRDGTREKGMETTTAAIGGGGAVSGGGCCAWLLGCCSGSSAAAAGAEETPVALQQEANAVAVV
jgi:hypothetical protein